MDQVYLNILKSRYSQSLKKIEPEKPAEIKEEQEIIKPIEKETNNDDIEELKNKLNKLIELKEQKTQDKQTKKQAIVNKKTNGNPSERALKMREAKAKKQQAMLDDLVKNIEGKDPAQVKKEINNERKKINLLKKIISDVK